MVPVHKKSHISLLKRKIYYIQVYKEKKRKKEEGNYFSKG